ncbi:hypothetical protein MMC32_007631 [Xylographa parallela]|nr:hypothetical protein [Xylographa parallela]
MGFRKTRNSEEPEKEVSALSKARRSEYGLKVLHDVEDAQVDIIFVHGLTGDRERTWTAKGAKHPWPQTLLPQTLPKARILTFGYDASFADWKSAVSKNSVYNHAEGLLSNVANFRSGDNTNDRHILFVAHSLGGLVCEDVSQHNFPSLSKKTNNILEALLMSGNSSIKYLQKILECTRGIAFMGTPHTGSDLTKWVRWVTRAPIPFLSTNKDILEPLSRGSGTLGRMEDDFCQMLARRNQDQKLTDIASFYETLEIRGVGVIVPRESAKLSLYANTPIHANHEDMTKFSSLQDEGYLSVSGQLQRWVREFGHLQGSISTVLYPPNPLFVGRKDILDDIDKFFKEDKQRQLALYGLGGIGKTQILLQYAHIYKHTVRRPVFWVSAVSASRFQNHYREIAMQLKLLNRDSDAEVDVLRLVKEALEKKDCGDWLMIVDNADEKGVLFDTASGFKKSLVSYVPENTTGSILYSTRSSAMAKRLANHTRKVGELTKEESRTLLSTNLNDITADTIAAEECTELLEELEYLPLAIAQAAAYMKCKRWSVAKYLAYYRRDMSLDLLKHEIPVLGSEECDSEDDHLEERSKNAVLRTFILTFRHLQDQDARAAKILSLMACYNWQNIPFELLRYIEGDSCWLTVSRERKIPGPFAASIGTLMEFSLVTTSVDDCKYTIHRLVKLSTLYWLECQSQKSLWMDRALERLTIEYPKKGHPDKAKRALFISHIDSLLDLYPHWKIRLRSTSVASIYMLDEPEQEQDFYCLPLYLVLGFCRTLCLCAEFLLGEAQYDHAERYTLLLCELMERHPCTNMETYTFTAEDDKLKVFVMYILAQIALAKGNSATVAIARLTWVAYRQTIGYWSDDYYLYNYNNIINVSYNIFNAFEGIEEIPLDEQLLLAEMMNFEVTANLGRYHYRPLEYEYDNINVIVKWARNRNIAVPFAVVTNIALAQRVSTQYERAEQSFRANLLRAEQEGGPRSVETLQAKTYLATMLYRKKEFDAARRLNQEVLDVRNTMFSDSHPRIIESRNIAALILHGEGKYLEAEECMNTLLNISERYLGPKNPYTLATANNLAKVLYSMEKLEAAEKYCKRAYHGTQELLGPCHIRTEVTRANLNIVFFRQGKVGYEWEKQDVGLEPDTETESYESYRLWKLRHDAAPYVAKEYDSEAFEKYVASSPWYKTLQNKYAEIQLTHYPRIKPKNDQTKDTKKIFKLLKFWDGEPPEVPPTPPNSPDIDKRQMRPDPAVVYTVSLASLGMNGIHYV